jgi:hypothetical protein
VRNLGRIRNVQGITGSRRPCMKTVCRGQMYGFLYKYEGGEFRLIFECETCKTRTEPGVTDAVTKEISSGEEALA